MTWGRNVVLKYGLGARNVFLKYGLGAKRLHELWKRGRNVFPIYGVGAKRLTKKWCELTMGREVCVPNQPVDQVTAAALLKIYPKMYMAYIELYQYI